MIQVISDERWLSRLWSANYYGSNSHNNILRNGLREKRHLWRTVMSIIKWSCNLKATNLMLWVSISISIHAKIKDQVQAICMIIKKEPVKLKHRESRSDLRTIRIAILC